MPPPRVVERLEEVKDGELGLPAGLEAAPGLGVEQLALESGERALAVEAVRDAAHALVLDLTAVDRVDSTGLGVLVGVLTRLRAGNGQLPLAAARGDVVRLLHATGLDKVLPLYPDVACALEL